MRVSVVHDEYGLCVMRIVYVCGVCGVWCVWCVVCIVSVCGICGVYVMCGVWCALGEGPIRLQWCFGESTREYLK